MAGFYAFFIKSYIHLIARSLRLIIYAEEIARQGAENANLLSKLWGKTNNQVGQEPCAPDIKKLETSSREHRAPALLFFEREIVRTGVRLQATMTYQTI